MTVADNKMRVGLYLVQVILRQPRRKLLHVAVFHLFKFPLKESGNVEENREDGDDCDVQTGLSLDGVCISSRERTAHGHVTIYRHQHRQVDRTSTTYRPQHSFTVESNRNVVSK